MGSAGCARSFLSLLYHVNRLVHERGDRVLLLKDGRHSFILEGIYGKDPGQMLLRCMFVADGDLGGTLTRLEARKADKHSVMQLLSSESTSTMLPCSNCSLHSVLQVRPSSEFISLSQAHLH